MSKRLIATSVTKLTLSLFRLLIHFNAMPSYERHEVGNKLSVTCVKRILKIQAIRCKRILHLKRIER